MKKIYKKLEKTVKTVLTILFVISFIFWFFYSLVSPIKNLTIESKTFDFILALSSLMVMVTFFIKVIPKVIKRKSLDSLDLKIGNTNTKSKKNGCKNCKKKKS